MTSTDTRAVQRRQLRFNSGDDVLAEIDRIVQADQAGTLRTNGNWSAGQIFNHLATWINYGYEGFPPGAHPPWIVRFIIRTFLKKKFLRDGMRPGVKIPKAPNGTFGVEAMSAAEGTAKLRAALQRLKNREPVKHHSPAFGEMSEDERISLHLRHAELHLSFLHY